MAAAKSRGPAALFDASVVVLQSANNTLAHMQFHFSFSPADFLNQLPIILQVSY
jgi:hypothetical protein